MVYTLACGTQIRSSRSFLLVLPFFLQIVTHLLFDSHKMKFLAVASLAGAVLAAPGAIVARQGGLYQNQITAGACPAGTKIAFVYARGSTEPGNMVSCPNQDAIFVSAS